MVMRFARTGWLTLWRLPRWAASSHGIIKYCTTYEATAPVNFDSPPQHEHCLRTYHSPCTVLRRTVGALPKGRQMLCGLTLTGAADFLLNPRSMMVFPFIWNWPMEE